MGSWRSPRVVCSVGDEVRGKEDAVFGFRNLVAFWRILAVLAGCSVAASSVHAQALSLTVTQYRGAFISFPAYVAKDRGFFAKHGLKVDLVDVAGGPAATAAIMSGSADIELQALDNNMLARAQGLDIVAVSGDIINNIYGVLVRSDLPLPHLAEGFPAVMQDLKGMKIGVTQRGSSGELIARELLKYAGMDPNRDVTFIAVGVVPTAVPAFLTKQIDVLMAFEPMTTMLVADRKATEIVDLTTPQTHPFLKLFEWNYDNWAALRSNVTAKREAFTRFQSAMKETLAWMTDPTNFSALTDIGVKELRLERRIVEQMLRKNVPSLGFYYQKPKVDIIVNYLTVTGLLKTTPKLPLTFEAYVLPEVRAK
ncbi:MAG: hypothetical protein EPO20_30330 [Betaproteobacteria bacterium]|nr:MAG: hypothetical protein EPO20_30330 [Betaproteobacteria bacterium]